LNDRRAILVGVCKASAPFQTLPVIYTRHSQALHYAPPERRLLPFVLAKPQAGVPAEEVCRRISEQTGLLALTQHQFMWKTINYYLSSTGIPVNFGITIALGFFVGVAIAGQTFYLFTIENLKQFGSLKAMGTSNLRLVAAAFFHFTQPIGHLQGFFRPWQVLAGTGAAVLIIVILASLLSIRRVLVLEPAMVFR
jgi:putative ABC transport system permease protein